MSIQISNAKSIGKGLKYDVGAANNVQWETDVLLTGSSAEKFTEPTRCINQIDRVASANLGRQWR